MTEGPVDVAWEPEQVMSGTLEKYENGVLFETIVFENNEIVEIIKHLEE